MLSTVSFDTYLLSGRKRKRKKKKVFSNVLTSLRSDEREIKRKGYFEVEKFRQSKERGKERGREKMVRENDRLESYVGKYTALFKEE